MADTLTDRSQKILEAIIEEYIATAQPVGSKALTRNQGIKLSPASVRNVMAELEELGYLASPHTSAGRIPTEVGLKLFVDGLLEVGNLTKDERESIEGQCKSSGSSVEGMLERATGALSGLSNCAGLVVAPKTSNHRFRRWNCAKQLRRQ